MEIETLAAQVDARLRDGPGPAHFATPAPRLVLFRREHPTELQPELYEPVLCLILQGRKETTFGGTTLEVGPGDSLLVSHDMHVHARITSARPDAPYLSIVLLLDMALIRSLYEEVRDAIADRPAARSAVVHAADPLLIDCLARYVASSSRFAMPADAGLDIKRYNGGACQSSSSLLGKADGWAYNNSSFSTLKIDCPAVRDQEASILTYIYAIDQSSNADVRCYASSLVLAPGTPWLGWWSPVGTTTGTSPNILGITLGVSGTTSTMFYITCDVPPRFQGTASGAYGYSVWEF